VGALVEGLAAIVGVTSGKCRREREEKKRKEESRILREKNL